MKKTLPSVRLSTETFSNVERAIIKHNEGSLVKLSQQDFRRYAYELLSQAILQNKLKEINVKLE